MAVLSCVHIDTLLYSYLFIASMLELIGKQFHLLTTNMDIELVNKYTAIHFRHIENELAS